MPPAPSRSGGARHWVFTLNHPETDESPEGWSLPLRRGEAARPRTTYAVWQLEVGESGTPHFQGYCSFERRVRLSALKKLSPRAHWEPRGADHESARAYCRKAEGRIDGPWEYGTPPTEASAQGKRNDLIALRDRIQGGGTMLECFDEHFGSMLRYHKAVEVYRRLRAERRSQPPEVFVYWGATGIGKSRTVNELSPNAYYKVKHSSTDWWDGYDGTADIVLEEFYGWLPWMWFLQFLDRYPMVVEVRGGTVNLNARRVFITSNSHPNTWYRYGGSMVYSTLRRRLTHIYYKNCTHTNCTECEWREEPYDPVRDALNGNRPQPIDVDAVPVREGARSAARTYRAPVAREMEIPPMQ